MKYLFLILVLTGCTKATTISYEEQRSAAKDFAKTLVAGDCFRYEDNRKAQFEFEKDYRFIDQTHVVIARDANALLIAQPNPDCRFSADESHKCDYWFRTVPFKDMYLIHGGEKKIKCSDELSLKNMVDRLEKSEYSNRYSL